MKNKDDELRNLRTELRNTKKQFSDELAARDVVITELAGKVKGLTQNVDSTPVVGTSNDTPIYADEPANDLRVEHDFLVIGDSLVGDLDVNILNLGGDSTVSCLPGARPSDVVTKFRELTKKNRYKRIIVHVGSNLIPKFAPETCSARIIDCLEDIRKLAPASKLAFSEILPKIGNHLVPGINRINFQVIRSGKMGPSRTRYGYISHATQFTVGNTGSVDTRLFRRDGIHLTDNGRLSFAKSLNFLVKL